jgi:hypothetical protein
MKMPDAYFGGLFDGEGYTAVYKSHNAGGNVGFGLTARVLMGNKEILLAFQERFGGTIIPNTPKRREGLKSMWVWRITKNKKEFFMTIFPYLIEKRDQVELALEYIEEFGTRAPGKPRTDKQKERQFWYEREFKRLKRLPERLGVAA